ncbi:MAG: DEAD/DEAH box helicase family protein [Eubacteriales bacterium]|nr:DEAD/DEAH box helicase family protein [Eubacteriales bacterium]
MNRYDGVLQFCGTWRTYQQRVLDRAETYLADRKLHIVAAPGSGKTTLGIELIRRQGEPCLILTPSITIREQWISRMEHGFLMEGNDPADWFSNDLKESRPITAVTYQALHSCMKRQKGTLSGEDGEGESETVDYSDFDVREFIAGSGVRTVCLDEAHHLRSEWWKALEEFLGQIPELTLISLTATPPYDSTPAQWKRYIDLCGPIDEEIFTPELVREGSLCPHQDYVYLNWPTKEEEKAARDFSGQAQEIFRELRSDKVFVRMVASHRGILSPMEYGEKFLDHPKYFSSILIFLHENQVPFSPYLKELTGTKGRFPGLSPAWMEALLQGFLYDDADAYPSDAAYREQLTARLKAAGCIRRNKVQLEKNEEIGRLLTASRGKLNSIVEIVRAEYGSMGERLRLLVLCDFIKKEMLSAVGDPEKPVHEIGAVPIFENLRRKEIGGLRLGVLSGSVVILPSDTEQELRALALSAGCECSMTPLGDTGYSRVSVRGSGHRIVAMITELFSRGGIHVLIGTKSLLGEGWDSPCINSLILATYVGSFMLSNQMRGRAIRVWEGDLEKTGNIWHLACILPQKYGEEWGLAGDYETLERRFRAFLGVSCTEDVIESGIGRLGLGENLDSKSGVRQCNEKTLRRAVDRKGLRRSWERSLKVIHEEMSVEETVEMDEELAAPGYLFFNAVVCEIVSALCLIFSLGFRMSLRAALQWESAAALIAGLFMLAACVGVVKYGVRIFGLCTPQKRMRQAADGILGALIRTGQVEEPLHCRAVVEQSGTLAFSYLKGGSTRDKTLFAKCAAEFWGPIDNPRYVLALRGGRRRTGEFYAVPEALGRKKEDAAVFAGCMKRFLGPYEAVYTRTPEGRRLLLKARTRSFVNKNYRRLTDKKRVKSEFE